MPITFGPKFVDPTHPASLANVVEDTSPQLGGTLDIQANLISGNGGTTGIAIGANGELTFAKQSCVLATPSGTLTNVTGDGTVYTVVWATEIIDQNADFDGTSTFKALVAGVFQVNVTIAMGQMAADQTICSINLVASNRTILLEQNDGGASRDANNNRVMGGSALIDMDIDDTFTITLQVSNGSKVVDVNATSYLSVVKVV